MFKIKSKSSRVPGALHSSLPIRHALLLNTQCRGVGSDPGLLPALSRDYDVTAIWHRFTALWHTTFRFVILRLVCFFFVFFFVVFFVLDLWEVLTALLPFGTALLPFGT